MNTSAPKIIKIAGWLWLVYGVIISLFAIVLFFLALTNNDINKSADWSASVILGVFALALLHIGRQTLYGKAKDTVGNSIGSILFASFGLYSFPWNETQSIGYQIGSFAGPGILILAGILAFIGRREYKEWVSYKQNSNTAENDFPVISDNTTEDKSPPITSNHALASKLPRTIQSNYFIRHWRGELSLPVSYWVNGSILSIIITVLFTLLFEVIDNTSQSLRLISFGSLFLTTFLVMFAIWSSVGIWRSSNQHESRGGLPVWGNLAKLMVVIGVLSWFVELSTSILPQVKEHALIAIGNDPIGHISITVSDDGKAIVIEGGLREGSATKVHTILDAVPGAKTLILNSYGGRLFEAEKIAGIVRKHKLNTYVEKECVSACTFIFLAGRNRLATPNAKIGFHQPSFPGLDATTQVEMTNSMLDYYRDNGIADKFLTRIKNISPDDMWYPTQAELFTANVITRIDYDLELNRFQCDQGDKRACAEADLAEAYAEVDKEFPLWQSAVKTSDFSDWLNRQSSDVQSLAASDEVYDAISLMGLYENHRIVTGLPSMKNWPQERHQ